MNFTGSDRGDFVHALHPATAEEVASALAARANTQSVTADVVACDTLMLAVDARRLPMKFLHLLYAASDTGEDDMLPAPPRLSFGGQFGLVYRINFKVAQRKRERMRHC